MNIVDYTYLYGDTLIDSYHFVELFIACMQYKEGVIDVDKDFSYATRDTGGRGEISLSTCTTDASKRLVIWAAEI